MRDGLAARSGRDFRTYHGKSRRKGRGASFAGAATGLVARNPGIAFAAFLFVAAAAAIAFNALTLQQARHPAPLFAAGESGLSAIVVVPAPPPAPHVDRSASAPQEIDPRQPAPPTSIADLVPPPPPSRPAREAPRQVSDPIGALIRGEDIAATTGSIAAEPDLRVREAQRALANLGYGPLAIDGLDGPMTRDAIRRFERAQGLAVTGSLNADTVRALAIRSGVALD